MSVESPAATAANAASVNAAQPQVLYISALILLVFSLLALQIFLSLLLPISLLALQISVVVKFACFADVCRKSGCYGC